MTSPRHLLSSIDAESRRAECAVCGSVKIYRNGRAFICANKSRAADVEWRKKNPAKVNEGRAKISAHHLLERDLDARTGLCPVDGLVDIVPYGRGFACGVRARQLRGSQQERPADRCWKCRAWESVDNPLEVDGSCRRCTDELVPGRTLLDIYDRPPTVERLREATFLADCDEAGMHISYPVDPYDLDDQQAVKGWKTIGSPLPTR